jgi:hypothetical protein
LNARAAILAAANPAYGRWGNAKFFSSSSSSFRYNTSRTPSENINLPAALLSRFDLLFLLLDKPNWERDMALAKHIAHVHIHSAAPALDFEPSAFAFFSFRSCLTAPFCCRFSSEFLRSYIAKAKSFEPFVPEYLSGKLKVRCVLLLNLLVQRSHCVCVRQHERNGSEGHGKRKIVIICFYLFACNFFSVGIQIHDGENSASDSSSFSSARKTQVCKRSHFSRFCGCFFLFCSLVSIFCL